MLARLGEGPAAIYLRHGRANEATIRLRALGVTSVAGPGPFGPEHLVLAATPAGPHLVLAEVEVDRPSRRTVPPGTGARALPSAP
jgi:hypothetical protein